MKDKVSFVEVLLLISSLYPFVSPFVFKFADILIGMLFSHLNFYISILHLFFNEKKDGKQKEN